MEHNRTCTHAATTHEDSVGINVKPEKLAANSIIIAHGIWRKTCTTYGQVAWINNVETWRSRNVSMLQECICRCRKILPFALHLQTSIRKHGTKIRQQNERGLWTLFYFRYKWTWELGVQHSTEACSKANKSWIAGKIKWVPPATLLFQSLWLHWQLSARLTAGSHPVVRCGPPKKYQQKMQRWRWCVMMSLVAHAIIALSWGRGRWRGAGGSSYCLSQVLTILHLDNNLLCARESKQPLAASKCNNIGGQDSGEQGASKSKQLSYPSWYNRQQSCAAGCVILSSKGAAEICHRCTTGPRTPWSPTLWFECWGYSTLCWCWHPELPKTIVDLYVDILQMHTSTSPMSIWNFKIEMWAYLLTISGMCCSSHFGPRTLKNNQSLKKIPPSNALGASPPLSLPYAPANAYIVSCKNIA